MNEFSVRRNAARYATELDTWVEKFLPWYVEREGDAAQFVLATPADAQLMSEYSQLVARRMVTGVAVSNAKSWREAAARSLRARQMYQSIAKEMGGPVGVRVSELIRQQQQLIQRIPQRVAKRAQAYIGAQQRAGVRADVIAEALRRRLPSVIESQLRMFARTEVGRAETALTRARSERMGIGWYEWETSHDSRVRPAHKLVAGVLVSWNDPPNPEALAHIASKFGHYAPGEIYNCRCIALPLIDLNEVRWPHKVYAHGVIQYVNRAQFERWIRLPSAA